MIVTSLDSSLLSGEHKVIGQLRGGLSDCDNLYSPDWYGKFSSSWTGNGDISVYRRLDHWLDSLNTGRQSMEGLLVISSSVTLNMIQQLYSNIRIRSTGQLIIQSDIELEGSSSVIVEAGGRLIIDGGKLSNAEIVLKPGAFLSIVNNGVIETRNVFEATVGAIVEIEYGQIYSI